MPSQQKKQFHFCGLVSLCQLLSFAHHCSKALVHSTFLRYMRVGLTIASSETVAPIYVFTHIILLSTLVVKLLLRRINSSWMKREKYVRYSVTYIRQSSHRGSLYLLTWRTVFFVATRRSKTRSRGEFLKRILVFICT